MLRLSINTWLWHGRIPLEMRKQRSSSLNAACYTADCKIHDETSTWRFPESN